MRTYPVFLRVALTAAALGALVASPAQAQRKYLIEVSAAPLYQGFDQATDLDGAVGGLARLGIWLPARFEVEVDGSYVKPKTSSANFAVSVKSIGASLIFNIPVGASSAYLKGGIASTSYGGECPTVSVPGSGPCGSTTGVTGGVGFRAALTQTVMARAEGTINHSNKFKFSNFGGSLGLAVMLGSIRIVDSDKDGVLDSRDRCPATPLGALVDSRGCPTDADKDGVADGIDRCPNTPANVKVDGAGCPRDSDGDGVPDGVDRCDDTPAGAAVDPSGCPTDSDKDGVADGLDRCPDTPAGAAVDQLGCPGDSDGDGVLDGLDRCPNTPPGTRVNAFGCPPGETGEQRLRPNIDPGRAPTNPPPANVPKPAPAVTAPIILRGVTFAPGSARLSATSNAELDSVAKLLLGNPGRYEVAGHTDNTGAPQTNLHLSTLRAEAVRRYLIGKGVPFQWLTAKGYGPTQPLSTENTPAGRAQNRRVEIRPLATGP